MKFNWREVAKIIIANALISSVHRRCGTYAAATGRSAMCVMPALSSGIYNASRKAQIAAIAFIVGNFVAVGSAASEIIW